MGIFGKSKKDKEIDSLKNSNNQLKKDNYFKTKEIDRLERLSDEKDAWMDAVASESFRNGGSLGAKVLSDKKQYLKDKKSN